MKNLNPYSKKSIDFFDKVLNSKQDTAYVSRVNSLRINLVTQLTNYDSQFNSNSLVLASPVGYSGQNKTDLGKLYGYKRKAFRELETELTTNSNNRRNNTCQNCTLEAINSFDHILPQTEFIEFVVHPKNLFPSCTTCNSHKSKIWRKNGKTLFLNLYLDTLPQVQYLFVEIRITSNLIEPTFYLQNLQNINPDFYELLENHYSKLHLYRRFKEKSGNVIEEIENSIKPYKNSSLSKSDLIFLIKAKIKLDQDSFGINYWKSILELELINNNSFIDNILK
jgi:hypothetical protein